MVDIHEAERQLRRMKLRAGIIRYLTKNYRHVNSIRGSFRWATDEEFYAAVESLLTEGVAVQSAGRLGGQTLTLVETTKETEHGQ
jgi:hypothetical protein